MSPRIQTAEVLSIPEFLAVRQQRQAQVLEAKAVRRVELGQHMSLLFENRRTLLWQIQEMCRVEQIRDPAGVAHEVETYSALLAGPHELSASLMVEYAAPAERAVALTRLVGLQQHLWLVVGARRIAGRFDPDQYEEGRISAVQFVRFDVDAETEALLFDLRVPAALAVDHPWYTAHSPLKPSTRGALVEDLTSSRTLE